MTRYVETKIKVSMDEAARIFSMVVNNPHYRDTKDIQIKYKDGELSIGIMEDAWHSSSVHKLVGYCHLKHNANWIFGEFGA